MWWYRIALLAFASASLSACNTYRLEKPDQLYLGQSYLPLPSAYPTDELPPNAQGGVSCAEAPALPRSVKARRESFQPLPGMTLHVTESTYRRDSMDALPVLTEWSWRLPASSGCSSAAPWTRRDTLVVRHLLSGARLNEATPDPGYFADMVHSAACSGGTCATSQLLARLFDPVVRNLKIVYRKPQQRDDNPGTPALPLGVSAAPNALDGLSGWFREQLVAARDEDLFAGDFQGQKIVDICARLYGGRLATKTVSKEEHDRDQAEAIRAKLRAPLEAASDDGDVSTATWEEYRAELDHATQPPPPPPAMPPGVDGLTAEACNFSYKSLLLQPEDTWPPNPGAQKGDFVLLTTGDALMLFRPLAHKALLDSSRRNVCPAVGGGAGRGQCDEAGRVSQGFEDFNVTFKVHIEGQQAPVVVTPDTTLADLEARYGEGGSITELRRSPRWIPENLIVNDLQHNVADRPLGRRHWEKDGALRIVFVPDGSKEDHGVDGVTAWASLKSKVLLAPDDEVVLAHPRQ